MRYAETGKRRYLIPYWLTFLLGFGVLETNIVYPAIATIWALCCARHVLRQVVPQYILSAIYVAFHFAATTPVDSGPYKTYWDAGMVKTLWTYWVWALGPSRLSVIGVPPPLLRSAATVFLAWKTSSKEWVIALFPGWFPISLAPLLPLREHVIAYGLTVPLFWPGDVGWMGGGMRLTFRRVAAGLYAAVGGSIPGRLDSGCIRRIEKLP